MNEDAYRAIMLELALASAGHKFPRLSHLVSSSPMVDYPVRVPTKTDGYSISILDVTLTDTGAIRLIEANGSNGGLTSIPFGNDRLRAEHMKLTFESKGKPEPLVSVLMPFKTGFMHLAEFFARAHDFSALLSQQYRTRLCSVDEQLENEHISIVCGTISKIANHIERRGRHVFFRGRKVAFACNPNLLPELERRSVISVNDGLYDIDLEFFHEGRLVSLIHDKAAQQVVTRNTEISPLRHSIAWSYEDCLSVIQDFHYRGEVAVGKMNAGSGGAGIGFFPPTDPIDAIRDRLNELFQSAEVTYGNNFSKTIFPVRFFEFARSTDYLLNAHPHLWDIRMQCLVCPNYVEVMPCIIRICPRPFDGRSYHWDSVVSNLSGRTPSLQFVRSAFDYASWKVLGIDETTLRRISVACAHWCESAWNWGSERNTEICT